MPGDINNYSLEDNQASVLVFQDVYAAAVDCPSTWKQARETADAQVQTETTPTPHASTQCFELAHKEVQTSEEKRDFRMVEDNSHALVQFLQKVRQSIENQLGRNLRSRVFDGYDVSWEEEIHTISCLHELRPSRASAPELSATSLSWNCTGSLLAASYGRYDHTGWCEHSGILCIWSAFSRKLKPDQPDTVMETQVMVLPMSL